MGSKVNVIFVHAPGEGLGMRLLAFCISAEKMLAWYDWHVIGSLTFYLFDTPGSKLLLTVCGVYTIAQTRKVSACIYMWT